MSRQQAKDIADTTALAAVRDAGGTGRFQWADLWAIQGRLHAFHPKVVNAKLRKLKHRGLIEGCCCGCRGDFYLLDAGRQLLEGESS